MKCLRQLQFTVTYVARWGTGSILRESSLQFIFRFRPALKTLSIRISSNLPSGNLKGTRLPKVLEGEVNPFNRGLLFRPRLVLYLNRPEWAEGFRNPRYPVVLGRSQDLFTYSQIEVITLQESNRAYLEHTLAPYRLARRTGMGVVVLMPRFLDYYNQRHPTFNRYVILHRRAYSRDLLRYEEETPLSFLVDPTSPVVEGDHLGLLFHTWVGDDGRSF